MLRDNPLVAMGAGMALFGDIVLYTYEGTGKGLTVTQLINLKKAYGHEYAALKDKIRRVRENDVALKVPNNKVDYGKVTASIDDIKKVLGIFANAKLIVLKGPNRVRKVELRDEYMELEIKARMPPALADVLDEEQPVATSAESALWSQFTSSTSVMFVSLSGTVRLPEQEQALSYPTYWPKYQTFPPDHRMFRDLGLLVRRTPPNAELFPFLYQLYNDLIHTSEISVLSGGTLRGQIARLAVGQQTYNEMIERCRKMTTVLDRVSSADLGERTALAGKIGEPKITYEAYARIMNRICPFAKKPPLARLYTTELAILDATYTHYDLTPDWWSIVSINKDSSAGLYYNDQKKGTTAVSDLVLGTRLLAKCKEFSQMKPEDSRIALQKYVSAQGFDFLTELKNKVEIGDRERVENGGKWRNYFPYTSFAQYPAYFILRNIYKQATLEKDGSKAIPLWKNRGRPDSLSLMGWSPYHTNGLELLRTMEAEARTKGYSIAVYSDNIWVLTWFDNNYTWYSCDGSSMESSVKHRTVEYEMRRVVDYYWLASSADPHIVSSYVYYATHLLPLMSVDFLAVLGPYQFMVKGQGSGTNGTFINNHATMLLCAYLLASKLASNCTRQANGSFKGWDLSDSKLRPADPTVYTPTVRMGKDLVMSEIYEPCFAELTVKIKIEMAMQSNDFWDGIRNGASKMTGIVPLDLLGEDIICLPELAIDDKDPPFFFILERQRLLNALCYNKIDAKYDKNSAFIEILRLFRLSALYLVGGWAYPGMAQLLKFKTSTSSMFGQINPDAQGDLMSAIETLASSIEGDLPELGSGSLIRFILSAQGVPSIFNMLTLHRSIRYADSYLTKLITQGSSSLAFLASNLKDFVRVSLRLDGLSEGSREDLAKTLHEITSNLTETADASKLLLIELQDLVTRYPMDPSLDGEEVDIKVLPTVHRERLQAQMEADSKKATKVLNKRTKKPAMITQVEEENVNWADLNDEREEVDMEAMKFKNLNIIKKDKGKGYKPKSQRKFFQTQDKLKAYDFLVTLADRIESSPSTQLLAEMAEDALGVDYSEENLRHAAQLVDAPPWFISDIIALSKVSWYYPDVFASVLRQRVDISNGDILYAPGQGW
jgi:hypothetical protein